MGRINIYKSSYDHALEGMFRTAPDGRCLEINNAMARMLGYDSPEEFLRNVGNIRDIYVFPDDWAKFIQEMETNEQVRGFECQWRQKNNTLVWISLTVLTVQKAGERIIYHEGFVQDIRDRKKAEASLRDREEKYRFLTDNIPDIIFSLDKDGNVSIVNEEALRRYGYTKEEVIGGPFLQFIHDDDKEKVLNNFLTVLSTRQEYTRGLIFRIVARRGTAHWVELNSHYHYDQEGRFRSEEGVLRDIDDRIKSEERQRRVEEQLILSKKMEAMGALADEIAHDFNNTLSGIMGMAEIAMTRCLPPDSPGQTYLEDIINAGNRAKKVIAQIRSLAASGSEAEIRSCCLLHKIIEEALHLAEATLPKEITIIRDTGWKTACILADPTRLHQMIFNLLMNAIQSIDIFPGKILVSLKKADLSAHSLPHTDLQAGIYARLTIRDSGRGIAPENMGRIFDPFFSTRKAVGGTGMGLAATYGIVRQCGGAITVESQAGKGSTFTVYLPAAQRTGGVKPSPSPTPQRRKANTGILLVDDDELVTRSFRMLLEGYGYNIDAYGDPGEALAAFCRNPQKYDLAILDMIMPGMTGMELAQRIKDGGTAIKILMCTGYLLNISPAELLETGITEVLYKPLTGADLAANVERILSRPG